MTPRDERLRLDLFASRYLDAFESHNFDAMSALWEEAGTDANLEKVLHELHAGLLEEQLEQEAQSATNALTEAVTQHLPSAEILRPTPGPVTVAEVAEELFRRPPPRLSAAAHALNEQLRLAREELPDDLGVSKLIAWAEAKYGKGPHDYWVTFRAAALELDLRRASEADYQMAARRAPRKTGDTP